MEYYQHQIFPVLTPLNRRLVADPSQKKLGFYPRRRVTCDAPGDYGTGISLSFLVLSWQFHHCSILHQLTLKQQCLKVYTCRSLIYAELSGRSHAEIVGSNPAEVMEDFLL